MAMGLYTALPGFARWDKESQGLLAPALPFVGLILGLLWWGIAVLARRFVPPLLGTVVIALALPLLTGFLHLDGYMDVADALLCARPREEKLRILKDPHTGAFAVIAVCCLLLVQVGAADALPHAGVPFSALVLLPVASRALTAVLLLTLRPLPQSSYGRMYFEAATPGRRVFCLCALVVAIAASFLPGWRVGVACLVTCAAGALVCWRAVMALGGMNGDIAGCMICCAEALGLAALACL